MSTKFSNNLTNSQNLKQHLKSIHSKSKSHPFTESSKKMNQHNFKCNLKNEEQKQTINSLNTEESKTQKKRKLSIKQSKKKQFLGFQNFKDNDQFLQRYNQDPIFRYKVQFLMTQNEKKLNKNPSINILKRKNNDFTYQREEQFSDQQSGLRITLKTKRSLNDMILMEHCQSYKEMIQKCHSQK